MVPLVQLKHTFVLLQSEQSTMLQVMHSPPNKVLPDEQAIQTLFPEHITHPLTLQRKQVLLKSVLPPLQLEQLLVALHWTQEDMLQTKH